MSLILVSEIWNCVEWRSRMYVSFLFVIIVPESLATVSHANWVSGNFDNLWKYFDEFYIQKMDSCFFCITCIFIYYQCYIDRGSVMRGTSSHLVWVCNIVLKKKLLYHVYYGTLPILCWYLWYIIVWPQADVRYCIVEWVHEIILHI